MIVSGRYEPCCKCGTTTWEQIFCQVGSTALMSQCQNGSMSICVLALCMCQESLGNSATSTMMLVVLMSTKGSGEYEEVELRRQTPRYILLLFCLFNYAFGTTGAVSPGRVFVHHVSNTKTISIYRINKHQKDHDYPVGEN